MIGIRSILMAALVLLAACGDQKTGRPADWHGPVAEARTRSHDFGSLFAGARETAVFMIDNLGDEDLEILRTHEDCGCTKPTFDRNRVPPGESVTMTVVFEAPAFHGTLRKRIRVETNDRWAATLEFEVGMEGLGQASLDLAAFALDGESIGFAGLRRHIGVRLPEGHHLEGVLLSPEAPFLRLEKAATGEGIDLVIDRPWHRLDLRDYLDFQLLTRDRDGKACRLKPQGIQLTGRIQPERACDPPIVNFGWVAAGESATRLVRYPGRLEHLRGESPEADLNWRPGPEEGVHELVLGPGEAGAFRRLLRLRQDDGAIVELPVLAFRSRP